MTKDVITVKPLQRSRNSHGYSWDINRGAPVVDDAGTLKASLLMTLSARTADCIFRPY
jgi:hypothetical protein